MKKLLPLLICYVLTQGQCYAISGGPDYGGNGNVSTTGSYSGIIQGVTETDGATGGAPAIPGDTVPGGVGTTGSSNALGLFDLVVPGTTTATGGFLLFADGTVFGGTISASVDPDSAKLSGILQGNYNFNETFFTATGTTTAAVTASALGMINAKIGSSRSSRAASAARLTGTAFLDVSFGDLDTNNEPIVARVITFVVSGFQTTTATTTASTIGTAALTGANGSGGAGG